jgi:hypothetical protein
MTLYTLYTLAYELKLFESNRYTEGKGVQGGHNQWLAFGLCLLKSNSIAGGIRLARVNLQRNPA